MPSFSFIDFTDSPLQQPLAIYPVDFSTDLVWLWQSLKGYKDQVEYRPKFVCVDNLDSSQFISVFFDNVRYPVNQFQRLTLPIPTGAITCRIEGDPLSLLTCEVIFSIEDIGAADTINFKAIQDSGQESVLQPIRLHNSGYAPTPANGFGIDIFLIGAPAAYALPDPADISNGYSVQGWNDELSTATVTVTTLGSGPPTINGNTSFLLAPGQRAWFVYDGSKWRTETRNVIVGSAASQPGFILRNLSVGSPSLGLGGYYWQGKDDADVHITAAFIDSILRTATAGNITTSIRLLPQVNNVFSTLNALQVSDGVQIGNPSGGFPGAGSLNLPGSYRVNNVGVAGPIFLARDFQASGVSGGSSGAAGAYNTVRLNNLQSNDLGVSVAGNQIQNVPPGTYILTWVCMAYNVDNFSTYIYNVTAGAQITTGVNGDAPASENGLSVGQERISIGATSTLELRRRVNVANLTDGGGQAVAYGIGQVFAFVLGEKVA